jgi:hypothetical protein
MVKDHEVSLVAGPPRSAPIVTGAPYSADEVQDYVPRDGSSNARSVVIGHFSRDSQGRSRMERAYNAPIWLTEIFDPVAGVAYLLDDQKKVAHRMTLPPAAQASASEPARPGTTVDKLESQSVEGVIAEGKRTVFGSPAGSGRAPLTVETWESPGLKLTLVTRSSNGYSSRFTNLKRTEPDASLFRPPSDYTVIDEREPFPMTVPFK